MLIKGSNVMWCFDQVFGPNEELVPAEQQPKQSKRGAAVQTGADYLPLLDRGETALSSTLPHGVAALLLVRFTEFSDVDHICVQCLVIYFYVFI